MAYRKRLTLYDFVCVFPWWVNAGLAVVSYFGMTFAQLFVGENRGLQLAAAGMPPLAPMVAGFFVVMAVCSFLRQLFFGKKKGGDRSRQPDARPYRKHHRPRLRDERPNWVHERQRQPDEPSVPRRVESIVRDEADSLCPFCGHAMVLRTAKKGPKAGNRFWGCSRYPECTGTRAA